jgi:protein-tyrosine phosphatase
MTYKLLFVCLGNICRSPSAENIMNHLIQEAGLTDKIVCDSAGTSGYHVGASPDRRMSEAAIKRGIKLQGKSRQLTPSDLQQFDLILAMDRENYQDILYLDYYGGADGFDYVIDLLLDACAGLLAKIVDSQAYQAKT